MHCFYHPDLPALGVCKSCMRGLCKECAAEFPQGIACRDRCEEDVHKLIELINFNLRTVSAVRTNVASNRMAMVVAGAFIAAAGGFFLWVGLAAGDHIVWVMAGLGGLLAGYGTFLLFRSLRSHVPHPGGSSIGKQCE